MCIGQEPKNRRGQGGNGGWGQELVRGVVMLGSELVVGYIGKD